MDLTEEQQKFLHDVEEEFKDRFSETDAVYWEEHTSKPVEPPIIDPWYNKPRRRFDYGRRGRGSEANGGRRDQDRSNYSRFDHRRDRSPNRNSRGSRPRYDEYDGNRNNSWRGGNYDRDRDRARDRDQRDHRHSDGYQHSQGHRYPR